MSFEVWFDGIDDLFWGERFEEDEDESESQLAEGPCRYGKYCCLGTRSGVGNIFPERTASKFSTADGLLLGNSSTASKMSRPDWWLEGSRTSRARTSTPVLLPLPDGANALWTRRLSKRSGFQRLQPFTLGHVGVSGRSSLLTVSSFEYVKKYDLIGRRLSVGFYVLELIQKLFVEFKLLL